MDETDAKGKIRIKNEDRQLLHRLGLDRFVDGYYYKYLTVKARDSLKEKGMNKPSLPMFIEELSGIIEPLLEKDQRISKKLSEMSPETRNDIILILSLAITQKAIREDLVSVGLE